MTKLTSFRGNQLEETDEIVRMMKETEETTNIQAMKLLKHHH